VAIGLSAGFLEPLESTSLFLVQSGLSRLIQFFPDTGFDQEGIDEHNRQAADELERIRDFVILHYHLTRRDDTAFWRRMRSMSVPDTLARRVRQFAGAGHLHPIARDLFTQANWLQVLVGQGLLPRRHHPLADGLTDSECRFFLEHVHRQLGDLVDALPPHGHAIARRPALSP